MGTCLRIELNESREISEFSEGLRACGWELREFKEFKEFKERLARIWKALRFLNIPNFLNLTNFPNLPKFPNSPPTHLHTPICCQSGADKTLISAPLNLLLEGCRVQHSAKMPSMGSTMTYIPLTAFFVGGRNRPLITTNYRPDSAIL